MNIEFNKAAEEIFNFVGSKENILSVGTCITRIRLNLRDNKKANIGSLKKVDGVLGVVETKEQFQIIIEHKKAEGIISNFTKILELSR
jgi:phosphotransferase system IIB component